MHHHSDLYHLCSAREKNSRNNIKKLVEKCLKGTAPSYFSKYFRVIVMLMTLGIRTIYLVVERAKLESTKRAFFYKGDYTVYC